MTYASKRRSDTASEPRDHYADVTALIIAALEAGTPPWRRPWDREQLAQAVEAASTLVTAGRRWIESLDINPLIFDGEGFVVVDAVCLVADSPRPLRGDGQPQ